MKYFVLGIFFVGILGFGYQYFATYHLDNQSVDVSTEEEKVKEEPSDSETIGQGIVVDAPRQNDLITSPLTISGRARGTWFFEASFPVTLVNWDGLIIAEGYVTATDNWMTEDFVDFVGTLAFEKPSFNPRGTLILRKDNPSGLPEHDGAVEIPILFK